MNSSENRLGCQRKGWKVGKMGEGSEKVQSSGYKVDKSWGSNIHRGQFSSVQFSCSVMSDCLRPHRLQHIRLPCPSASPRAYSNSHPLS